MFHFFFVSIIDSSVAILAQGIWHKRAQRSLTGRCCHCLSGTRPSPAGTILLPLRLASAWRWISVPALSSRVVPGSTGFCRFSENLFTGLVPGVSVIN